MGKWTINGNLGHLNAPKSIDTSASTRSVTPLTKATDREKGGIDEEEVQSERQPSSKNRDRLVGPRRRVHISGQVSGSVR
jgi:hypothetical protein